MTEGPGGAELKLAKQPTHVTLITSTHTWDRTVRHDKSERSKLR